MSTYCTLFAEKKFITGGGYADYFTTAVRTGDDAGMGGISLLLIEKGMSALWVCVCTLRNDVRVYVAQ
jgi:alkylation response protein AidB-like acyl-CoA dehydrogenase